ncbi:hypothetical protein ACFV3R_27330 [Streptomyces sp. NPDC059740]
MYSIEMAYARMRELQDQANRSRAVRPAPAQRSRRPLFRALTRKH